jgi:hypothetical protein
MKSRKEEKDNFKISFLSINQWIFKGWSTSIEITIVPTQNTEDISERSGIKTSRTASVTKKLKEWQT